MTVIFDVISNEVMLKMTILLFLLVRGSVGIIYLKVTNKEMFRNIYIEAYKNAIKETSTLEMMMCHANHLYSAMGCILQDIEFMVANMITQVPKATNSQRDRMSMPEKIDSVTFNMPKVEFLPSSSFKCEPYSPIVECSRSNATKNMGQNVSSHNSVSKQDSFE